jgi:FkbM family methyltransferase
MEMLPLLPNASFHLFEPHPNHTRELAALCAARPNLRFHDYGLGDSDSARELTLHGGQSSLLTSTQWQSDKASISVRRADAVVGHDGVTPPGLIKVDIQGAELMFLAGAQRVLSDCPFLLIEVSWLRLYDEAPYAEEVLQATSALGFHVYDICTYSQRRKDARLAQSDLLLAHTKTGLFDDVGW